MSDDKEEQMKERLERLLGAPNDWPFVIDKGHDRPRYDDATIPSHDEEKRHEEGPDS